MRESPYRLFLWPHRLLFLGPGFDTDLHRHHAAQLCVGLHGPLRMRDTEDGPWQQGTAFYMAPDTPHVLDASESPVALLYLDPEGPECRHACQRFAGSGIQPVPEQPLPLESLRELALRGGAMAQAGMLCRQILGEIPDEPPALDARLKRALGWLHDHLEDNPRLSDLARAASVSQSWLSHRFTREIGVPLRRYVLWHRLRLALEAAMNGASLTAAAHTAGFADSAHLSRTFRETFGVTPSFLFANRQDLDIRFADTGKQGLVRRHEST